MARKSRNEEGAELALSLMTPDPAREAIAQPVTPPADGGFDMLEIPDPDLSFGGAKREADGLYVNGVVAPAAPPAREITFAEIASEVQKRGIAVTLPEVARWTPELRGAVCDWLRGGGESVRIPNDLALYVSRRKTHALVDVNAGTRCLVCGDQQYKTPSGESCKNGHGGAVPIQFAKESAVPPPVSTTYSRGQANDPPKGDAKPANVPLIVTANKGPGINPDMARIIETIFAADAFKDYEDLEKNLEVGEERGDAGSLRMHLDKAEQRARRAHRLYLGAKLELARWEIRSRQVVSVMREKATEELEGEKAAGDRKKMITNADVEAKMAERFPDEWEAQELMRVKMKCLVEDMEHQTRRWDSKCVDLRTMLETLRR